MLFNWLLAAFFVSCLVVQGICAPLVNQTAACRHDWLEKFTCKNDPSGQHTGISEGLLHDFRLMSQYAAAAYCPGNLNSPGTQVTCPVGNCPLVEMANATTMLEFTNTKLSDDSGFVAVDDKNKFVVVSFRGTLSKLNWKVDLTLTRRATAWCEGCFVHKGFWEAWQEIRGKIIPLVKQARIEHPDYRVRITGHSLGAAIATLAATEFRMMDPHYLNITELYSYGSPRIANRELAIYMTSLSTLSYRITAMDDAVPRSPFAWWGYRHISPEYWIFRNSNNPKADEIEVLEGYYNPHGNSRTHWLAIEAHRGYFGPISNCATAK